MNKSYFYMSLLLLVLKMLLLLHFILCDFQKNFICDLNIYQIIRFIQGIWPCKIAQDQGRQLNRRSWSFGRGILLQIQCFTFFFTNHCHLQFCVPCRFLTFCPWPLQNDQQMGGVFISLPSLLLLPPNYHLTFTAVRLQSTRIKLKDCAQGI